MTVRPAAGALFRTLLVAAALAALALAPARTASAQEEFEVTIETTLGGTETFWLQIPAGYTPGTPRPLLIGWHQWGGNHDEMQLASDFDAEANARGWIAASHDGPSPTHWNNQATQSHVVDVIRWIEERYSVDPGPHLHGRRLDGRRGRDGLREQPPRSAAGRWWRRPPRSPGSRIASAASTSRGSTTR